MPAGNYLGQVLAKSAHPLFLVPIAMIMGYFIVKAEPAVYVLNKQVEEITDGAIFFNFLIVNFNMKIWKIMKNKIIGSKETAISFM